MLVTSELQVIMVCNKKKKIVRQDRFTCPFFLFEESLEMEVEANERWHILCERQRLPVLLLPSSLSI